MNAVRLFAEVAKAAAKRGTHLEINAKHPEFTVEELKMCIDCGVKFSINSDAHSPGRVGDIMPALIKAQEAGLCAKDILNAKEENK